MLVLCVMPTANMELKARVKSRNIRQWLLRAITAFAVFMVVGRLISGVHWVTDIMGGALLSTGLVWMYKAFVNILVNEKQQ
jgi:undecaprenyl-diphosphatase